jgi:hypothetical protein
MKLSSPPSSGPAKVRSHRRKARDNVTVSKPWLPLPLKLIRSRRFAELSGLATKLFFDAASMLGANGYGNGDIGLTYALLQQRGWKSKASLAGSIKELIDSELLIVTRQGGRRRCSLYALTPWPIYCDQKKLDVGRAAYSVNDWSQDPKLSDPPTVDAPAHWQRSRAKSLTPTGGAKTPVMPPQPTSSIPPQSPIAPGLRAEQPHFASSLPPPVGTSLDSPSPLHSVGALRGGGSDSSELLLEP